ncbi:PulJ/GspJ family protein [Parachitinimonas caeni]|uniref:Prepilin-type N-terminal cleavage/methylation domain-containing protein n=1 Tax=Parachitinimonas caeni TaxID=3031301 RepID=A0ABT7DZJ8_9NEIS|nr:prepilin-type N-terminal cleavage/methylation domain-containing protein [Parachitinimonas caeni]MDK2125491.1 prepilin-type N-terminal cleavage/methylation domain-containing protein [Parachitinimonas caeni]
MNRTPRSPRRQSGFTLVELAIVVAVGLILAALGWTFLPDIIGGNAAKKMITAIQKGVPSIQTHLARQAQVPVADITNQVAQWQLVPSDMIAGTGNAATVVTEWGTWTFAGMANNIIRSTINRVPDRECRDIVRELNTTTYRQVLINGTVVKAAPGAQINLDTVATNCNTDSNTIIFEFSKG